MTTYDPLAAGARRFPRVISPDEINSMYFYVGHPYAESYFQFGVAAQCQVFELVPKKMVGWDMREVALPQWAAGR